MTKHGFEYIDKLILIFGIHLRINRIFKIVLRSNEKKLRTILKGIKC